MKRIFAIVLIVALMSALLVVPAAAVGEIDDSMTFIFELSASTADAPDTWSGSIEIEPGDEITVRVVLRRTDDTQAYKATTTQLDLRYNTAHFELVSGTLTANAGFAALELGNGRLRVSRLVPLTTTEQFDAEFVIATFKLKAIEEANTTIAFLEDWTDVITATADKYFSTVSNLSVKIGDAPADPGTTDPGGNTGGYVSPEPAPRPEGGGFYSTDGEDYDILIGDDEFQVPLSAFARQFDDLPSEHWAYEYVQFLVEKGVVSGISDTSFAPSSNVTRAQFITMLARMSGDDLPEYDGSFTDVPYDEYYTGAVAWAIANNVTVGTSDTTFSPNANITRQDMAVMVIRFAASKGYGFASVNTKATFSDNADINDYAQEAVSTLQQANIINGYTDGSFRPLNNATRAEAAKIMAFIYYSIYPETAEAAE